MRYWGKGNLYAARDIAACLKKHYSLVMHGYAVCFPFDIFCLGPYHCVSALYTMLIYLCNNCVLVNGDSNWQRHCSSRGVHREKYDSERIIF